MQKLIRITTVPLSLEKLLEGQLTFMQQHYEVTAISAEPERLQRYGTFNDVKVFPVEMTREITPFRDLGALIRLYRILRKEKPLIVHTHTPKAGILGMLAARMAGVPVRLHTVAGMPLMETSGMKRKLLEGVEKFTYACTTMVYPNSFGLKEIILKEKLVSPLKIKVLGNGSSNGIDTSYFDPELYSQADNRKLRNKLGIPKDDFVFVFVGRLVADKGINELIEAFVEMQAKDLKISLLLVGPFEKELDPIEETNLALIQNHPHIFSVGYQEDVRPYFAISDALVFPSYREGFPNVVMQAGAMGIPSIVSDINGCNEIIEEGVNGSIIPPKNKPALKIAMEKIYEREEWRKKLRENARQMITSNYERKDVWGLLLQEYRFWETQVSNLNSHS